jgi:hypothetical protein
MTVMERPTCESCPFWDASGSGTNPGDVWECHRMPPMLPTPDLLTTLDDEGHDDDPQKGHWPLTRRGDWCGEHPDAAQYAKDRREELRRAELAKHPEKRPRLLL